MTSQDNQAKVLIAKTTQEQIEEENNRMMMVNSIDELIPELKQKDPDQILIEIDELLPELKTEKLEDGHFADETNVLAQILKRIDELLPGMKTGDKQEEEEKVSEVEKVEPEI